MAEKTKKKKAEKKPFAIAFGVRLAAARKAKVPEMTQDQLGAQIGGTKTKISQYENGVHMPDLIHLAALCDALGCSADELLGRAQQKQLTAAGLEEGKAFDALPREQQAKWRAMRLTLFSPV